MDNLQKSLRILIVLVIACLTTLISKNTFAAGANNPSDSRMSSSAGITAEDQAMNAADMEITRKIRQQILGNDTMSLGAQNVKIISQNGKVVLKGPVATPQEKTLIGEIAESVVGVANVTNDTTISRR